MMIYIRTLSFFVLFISFSSYLVDGYRILGLFPYPGKSHFDVFIPLLRELARRGHDVTVVSYFPEKSPLPNYKDISLLENEKEIYLEVINASVIKDYQLLNDIGAMFALAARGAENCATLGTEKIQNFVRSKPHFDVILEEHFNTDCYLALSYILKAPQIGLSSCTQMPWTYDRIGAPLLTSYVPNNLLYFSDQMTFFQRVHNTVATFIHNNILAELLIRRPNNQIVQKYFHDYNVPLLEDIAKNTSLFLLNTHFSLNRPRPLPPNIIEVSGIHIPKKSNPLPIDIEKFINESTHGVIYFSLGSMVKGTTFPEQDRNKFLSVFAQLPQRILWKYENDSIPGKPDNVLIKKWMPQFDILSHPNVKVYIGHGGLLGTIEGVYNGVPLITMPFFGDQFTNSKALERSGSSKILDVNCLTKEKIVDALRYVLSPSAQENAKKLSKAFRDRPASAMDTAIWWIEYVARNNGAYSMHSAVIDMPYYQAQLWDVYIFLLIVIVLVTYLFFKFTSFITRKIFSHRKKIKQQ